MPHVQTGMGHSTVGHSQQQHQHRREQHQQYKDNDNDNGDDNGYADGGTADGNDDDDGDVGTVQLAAKNKSSVQPRVQRRSAEVAVVRSISRPFGHDDGDGDDGDNVNDDDEGDDEVNDDDDGNIFEEEEDNGNGENEEHEEEDCATVGWSPHPARRRRGSRGRKRLRQHAQHQESNNTTNAIATNSAAGAPPNVDKYWAQRYRLFLRFDDGIQLDGDGWFSVTPERIAAHIAKRFVQSGHFTHVLDLFSGFGGNAIQFALAGSTVTGVEREASRIAMARHNSTVYGVADYIDYICDDVYGLSTASLQEKIGEGNNINKKRKREESESRKNVDAVFLSPPWGGPSYLQGDDDDGYYDLNRFVPALQIARRFSPNIAILVPRNVNRSTIGHVLGQCELELNHLDGKLKTCTIYFGGLMIHPEHEQVRRVHHFPLPSFSLTDDHGYGHPTPADDVDDDGQDENRAVAQ